MAATIPCTFQHFGVKLVNVAAIPFAVVIVKATRVTRRTAVTSARWILVAAWLTVT